MGAPSLPTPWPRFWRLWLRCSRFYAPRKSEDQLLQISIVYAKNWMEGRPSPPPPPPHRRCYVPDLSWWKIIRNFSFFFGKHTARDDWLHVQNVECGVVKSKEGVDGGWNRVLRHFFTSNICHIDGRIRRGVGVFRRKVLQLQCIFFECNWRLMYVTVYVRIACLTLKMAAFTYIYSISLLLNGCIFLSTFKM